MLIRVIKREQQRVDLVGLEHAARAEIDRVLGPGFTFPVPPPPTVEFRVYFYQQSAWWVGAAAHRLRRHLGGRPRR